MLRTNVYLTEDQQKQINLWATITKKPKAKVLRHLIDQGLKVTSMQGSLSTEGFIKLGKIAEQFRGKVEGPRDLSKNLDRYTWDE